MAYSQNAKYTEGIRYLLNFDELFEIKKRIGFNLKGSVYLITDKISYKKYALKVLTHGFTPESFERIK